jgi:hypothetical protein
VPFLLVPFLWARKEKALAEGRNKMLKQSTEPSHRTIQRNTDYNVTSDATPALPTQPYSINHPSFTKTKKATEVAFLSTAKRLN